MMVNMLKGKDCQPDESRLKARTMAMPRRKLNNGVHSRHPTCPPFLRWGRTSEPILQNTCGKNTSYDARICGEWCTRRK